MTYEEKPADGSYDVYFGIEWSESNVDGGTFTITPKIYRWDRYNTNNSGGRWSEDITEPGGSAGSWSNLQFGSGSGYRVIDTFGKRTYSKAHSSGTIYYHLYTDASFGTYNNGFYTLGAQTWTFTMTVPARTSYKVTLNANGGSGGTTSLTKWYGETLSLSTGVTNPTRSGYTFAGWYENSSGTGSKITSYTGNAAKTYYAKWTPNTYTMTYKSNYSGGGSDQTQTKTHAVDATVKAANTYSRTGYTFSSWNTKANGSGTTYSAGGKYTTNAAVTLYAIWAINTWTVSYNGNNATGGSTASQIKSYNKALTLRTNGFTRTNYSFVNWNTAQNGSGTSYAAGATLPASVNNAVTLYAQWSLNHANPSIGTLTVKRCDANGDLNVEGRCMLVQASWTCDSSATGNGTAVVSANGVNDTVTFSGTSGSISARIHQNSGGTKTDFPIGNSYKVTLTVTDSAGYSSSKITTLSVAFFTMHFKEGGTGVGIGMAASEDNLLDVGMPLRLVANSSTNNSFIRFKSLNRTADAIRFYGATDGYGDGIVIGDGGMTVIGSGESADSWYQRIIGSDDQRFKNFDPGAECLCLTSDNAIYFIVGANTVSNRKAAQVNSAGNIQMLEDDVDTSKSNNGVSENTYRNFGFLDSNDRYIGYVESAVWTDGETAVRIGARNFGTGANVDNILSVNVMNDGTRRYSVSSPEAFRSAIGLSDTPTSVTTIASVITVNSTNATISSVNYKQWGRVASLRFTWTNKNAISVPASGNISNFTIGTVVAGKRPGGNLRVAWHSDGDNAGAAWGYIDSDGTIGIGAAEGTGAARTIAASSTFVCYAAYVLTP